MFNASSAYWDAALSLTRRSHVKATILTESDTYDLTAPDFEQGGLSFTATSMNKGFQLGGAVAASLTVNLVNRDGRWNGVALEGATVIPYHGFTLADETIEWVPLGVFIIDRPGRPYSTLQITATDKLLLLDEPLRSVPISYPITLRSMLIAIGTFCAVPIAPNTLSLSALDYSVMQEPEDASLTCRDAVSEMATMAAGFARMSRTGNLEIVPIAKPLLETAKILPLGSRKNFKQTQDQITITGMIYGGSAWGTNDYAIEIPELSLLAIGDVPAVMGSVWSKISGLTYTPYTADYYGISAIDPGDTVVHEVRGDITVLSYVSKHVFSIGGSSSLAADGLDNAALNYKSANLRRMSGMVARAEKDLDRKLTAYEQASAQISDMVGLMLGVHKTIETLEDGSSVYYFHDAPLLEESIQIWKFNGTVLAWSNDGGATWPSGLDIGSKLVIKSIITEGINADWINTGSIDTGLIKVGDKSLDEVFNEISQEITALTTGGGNLIVNSNFGTGTQPSDAFWSESLTLGDAKKRGLTFGTLDSAGITFADTRSGDV